MLGPTPDWSPFRLAPTGKHADPPRQIHTSEGIGDRLRAAAFAEIQAREAFSRAADVYGDAPRELRDAWQRLAKAEDKHLTWLLKRLEELGIGIQERQVSDTLWFSLVNCPTAREFALFISNAEERGRKAGERFHREMLKIDPVTAQIFGKIAEEEIEHIALAGRFFN